MIMFIFISIFISMVIPTSISIYDICRSISISMLDRYTPIYNERYESLCLRKNMTSELHSCPRVRLWPWGFPLRLPFQSATKVDQLPPRRSPAASPWRRHLAAGGSVNDPARWRAFETIASVPPRSHRALGGGSLETHGKSDQIGINLGKEMKAGHTWIHTCTVSSTWL